MDLLVRLEELTTDAGMMVLPPIETALLVDALRAGTFLLGGIVALDLPG